MSKRDNVTLAPARSSTGGNVVTMSTLDDRRKRLSPADRADVDRIRAEMEREAAEYRLGHADRPEPGDRPHD
ncbi:hypothetical protein PP568_06855 [Mycobacteroides abscessus]|uniref:hypothetical protein n=1 Tax=Mycobacteroides abscessus TaxID=36809 RepID=UPI000698E434|nr:hypothetical protein [Mycobacteroides abscessus]MBN7463155.1 hypothetical protein [Mycobacteroides abscessus subsp. abscessus]MBN7555258.1 hypothetical protein [Mycobacteroides abscessus subsp. abscessus]MDM2404650.1 hypothetical protein [Mycobacteroides abscessus]MDM2414368.1 hypothetical protein [Mycobacteroides abscessus]MDO3012064.1 hypothetical protein [Mycobacteroides abscessus subsp. abscessus]